jgi:LPXTG-motif cell wall-anchored protein
MNIDLLFGKKKNKGDRTLKIKYKLHIKLFFLTIIPIFFMVFSPNRSLNAEEKPITLLPESKLFTVLNMAPGDSVSKSLTIYNGSSTSYYYNIKASHESGSKILYNNLHLQVTDNKGIIFQGNLKDFYLPSSRKLLSLQNEALTFKIQFPITSGNELQGLTTVANFYFSANGEAIPPTDSGSPDDKPTTDPPKNDTGFLPQTGEANSLFIILSGLFITIAGFGLLLINKPLFLNSFRRDK